MANITLFCLPDKTYIGKPEREVAEAYTNMAAHGYDALIKFDPNYAAEFVQIPDHVERVGKKGDRNIDFTIFAQQPVVKVGRSNVSLISSSNIFTPDCQLKATDESSLYLPDMEVIQISGSMQDVENMISGIKDLYNHENMWSINPYDGVLSMKVVRGNENRFSKPIDILDPYALRKLASEKFGYDIERLCF